MGDALSIIRSVISEGKGMYLVRVIKNVTTGAATELRFEHEQDVDTYLHADQRSRVEILDPKGRAFDRASWASRD